MKRQNETFKIIIPIALIAVPPVFRYYELDDCEIFIDLVPQLTLSQNSVQTDLHENSYLDASELQSRCIHSNL